MTPDCLPLPPDPAGVRTLTVFAPTWVGDAVMATPAWRALRTRFAGARLLAVCRPPVDAVLAGTGLFDAVVPMLKSVRGALEAAAVLRSERPDLGVLFPNSSRAALVAKLGGCRRTLGFARDGRGRLLTDPVPAGDTATPSPTLLNYNRLAAAAGCGEPGVRTELTVSTDDQAAFAAVPRPSPAPAGRVRRAEPGRGRSGRRSIGRRSTSPRSPAGSRRRGGACWSSAARPNA